MKTHNYNILAIETSCDDTSAAIVNSAYKVLANVNSTQLIHSLYGGVVPEIASRQHLKYIMRLTRSSLTEAGVTPADIDAVAVSVNPGLIGSLLVGVSYAKAFSYSIGKPLIAVNHLLGHVYANRLTKPDLSPPFLSLIVSGGHTELVYFEKELSFRVVGKTYDDAAGEAFDKTAKLLDLGYPGGPVIDKLSRDGNPRFVEFPRALKNKAGYNFSFSGLKTAVSQYLKKQSPRFIQKHKKDIAASVQQAIVDPLVNNTINYASQNNISGIVLAGGVSANSLLRKEMINKASAHNMEVYIPPIAYCLDNASMIAAAAVVKYRNNDFADLSLNPFPTKGIR